MSTQWRRQTLVAVLLIVITIVRGRAAVVNTMDRSSVCQHPWGKAPTLPSQA